LFLLSGIYGTQGEGTTSTTPGGRYDSTSWTTVDGTLWLFGGQGYDNTSSSDGEKLMFFFSIFFSLPLLK
jgi:hypothetical protein